jgi:hypothetical protein
MLIACLHRPTYVYPLNSISDLRGALTAKGVFGAIVNDIAEGVVSVTSCAIAIIFYLRFAEI